ncbi:MAG: hypothetical protein Fur006_70470 [Coleofasciculaceae cyanobacterium]
MANQEFVVESNSTTAVSEQLTQEIEQTPQEYLPNLLQLVRLFRQSVTLKPAEASFRQEWQEARTGETPQISQLHEGIHKNYVLDENQQPIAVQISIAEFERIEEIIEDLGLAKLMEEAEDEDNERLSKDEALKYYQVLKGKFVLAAEGVTGSISGKRSKTTTKEAWSISLDKHF